MMILRFLRVLPGGNHLKENSLRASLRPFVLLLKQAVTFQSILGSIVVSISACHAEDPGSIPGRGGHFFFLLFFCNYACSRLRKLS